jgi:hypothetical protein
MHTTTELRELNQLCFGVMRCYNMRCARENAVEIVSPTELYKLQD